MPTPTRPKAPAPPKLTGPQGQGYYAVLGVEFGTPTEQIQKKYKRAAILYHPDKVGDDREKIDMFQQLTTAYQVLSKPDAVRAYWEMYRMRCYLFQGRTSRGSRSRPSTCCTSRRRTSSASTRSGCSRSTSSPAR